MEVTIFELVQLNAFVKHRLAHNGIFLSVDISQTIVQEYFNMMMIADLSKVEKPFEVLANELAEIGLSMGVQVKCQREEIFDKMHRI